MCHASGGEMVVDQSTDYYPYGLSYENENLNLNRYLYSGKELQDQPINGKMLQLYDFGSRNYDPVLGRWFNIDPALQFTNPYLYCGNNPMMYTDPDGEFIFAIFSYVAGFVKGLFTGDNPFSNGARHFQNSIDITMGYFKGSFGQILSRLTWELPQTLLGSVYGQAKNIFGDIKEVSYYGGATVISSYQDTGAAVTLGSFISGGRDLTADPTKPLFMHEYGHYLQSQAAGPVYLARFGIPSLLSASNKNSRHNQHPVEQDANARAIKYFEDNEGLAHTSHTDRWDRGRFPINGYDFTKSYRDSGNDRALSNAKMTSYSWSAIIPTLIIPGIINSIVLHQKKQENKGNYPQ